MKKLWISIGMALGLLAAPAIATAQDDTPTSTAPKPTVPLSMYSFKSTVNTFYDLSTINEDGQLPGDAADLFTFVQPITFGADLDKGAALQNMFIVANKAAYTTDNPDDNADPYSLVTVDPSLAVDAAERNQLAIPLGSDMGMTHFCGQDVSGFAIAAIGGILFSDATANAEGYSLPGITCQNADYINQDAAKNFLRVRPLNWDASTPAQGLLAPTKGDKAPVIMAFALDNTTQRFSLWVQFDYMVGEMNWVFQIRYYADGQSDFIVKTLGTADQLTSINYRFTPVVLRDKANHIALKDGRDPDYNATWKAVQSGNFSDWDGMTLSKDVFPSEGQTLSIIPPIDPTAFSCKADDLTIESRRIAGKVVLDPTKTGIATFEPINAICILVTPTQPDNTSKPPFKTTELPSVGDKLTNDAVVAYIGKPNDVTSAADLNFEASQLTHNTEYYVAVYLGYYNAQANDKYTYSAAIASYGPFKTEREGLLGLSTAYADGHVTATIEPAAGMSTMLVKSNKATAPTGLNGKLTVGSKLGTDGADGEVIAILDADVKTHELTLAAGEGVYLHGYTVKDANSEAPVYTDYPLSTTAYRPAETLPTWGPFTAEQESPATTELPLLAPGWRHDENATPSQAFKMGKTTYPREIRGLTFYTQTPPVSVITPAFFSPTNAIQASFMVYSPSYQSGDRVTIEYRENGGEWKAAAAFTESFPEANEESLRPFVATFRCTPNALIEMRYTVSVQKYNYYIIDSVKITKGNPCLAPTDVTIAADATTDQAVKLSWDAIAEATAFTVAYQEAGTETPDAWTEKPATGKELTLDGLKARTAYRIKVSAACTIEGENLTSPFTDALTATTYAGAPYHESMDNVYEDPDDYTSDRLSSPADRGVTTYTGKIDGVLSENTGAGFTWHADNTIQSLNRKPETAMGVTEAFENGAVLLTPVIHVDREDLVLNVTLTSFSVTKNADNTPKEIVKGAAPKDAGCKLHIAVYPDGLTPTDPTLSVVKTLTGDELKLDSSVVKIQLEKKGNVQIGLFFDNPTPNNREDPHFYLEVSDLKLAPEEKFTLTAVAAPAAGGTVSGGGEFAATDEVTLRAIANNGYDFVAWKNGETELSTSAIYTFEMPGENVTYTAHFALHEYSLNLAASPAAAGTVEGAKKYTMGADVTIKATPAQGYVFVAWMNGETEVSKAAEYTFKMPASDLSYTAKFEKPQYELTLAPSSPRAGSVEGAGSYEADADVTIKATANDGFVFVAWMKGNDTLSREAEYTFKMPAEKTHYMALFRIDRTEYELTLTATPENAGTVTGGGSYEADADVTIKATANEGFVFVAWMNGNDTLSREAEYTFKMPAENTAYTALFAAKQVANEDVLRANFNLYAKDGRLHIRNLAGLTIASVDVYSLNGQRLNRFTPDSREDLSLAVAAERALVFVRIDTERGAVVYKVYLP